ncbi:MAG: hypothetical protein Q605_AUC00802G0006 [Actinomyces urogenitalis DORA_12]|uniref:Uncharacterized protein n=1 Tax=Actinomyces urogenitalis DORA_12 TaxID=1403939 RepID=W1VI21_9ACTO|nr:MAG: hypothetical protein Q605_AUC00802G0006 [Actinomyces urogenitalis DORA_12]
MTISNPFASVPSPTGGFKPSEHEGQLVIFEPKAVETDIQTNYGVSDAVRATVTILDGPGGVEEIPDALIFPKVLQSQLKPRIGEALLGRIGRGNAKPGQSAPWLVLEPTEADLRTGSAWFNQHRTPQVQTPQTSAPAATPGVPF